MDRYYVGEQGSREMLLNSVLGLKLQVSLSKIPREIALARVLYDALGILSEARFCSGVRV